MLVLPRNVFDEKDATRVKMKGRDIRVPASQLPPYTAVREVISHLGRVSSAWPDQGKRKNTFSNNR